MTIPADRDASVEDGIDVGGAGGGRRDPALTDAQAVILRVERDEAAADALREALRDGPMHRLEPDASVSPLLHPDEHVLAARTAAILNPSAGDGSLPGYGGTLYVTTQRLLHVGRVLVAISLDQIRELSLAGERLLLTLDGGQGVSVDTDHPRLLRVEISAAQRSAR